MDRLAKQQACQLFIEQEIEKGLKDGKTKYAIGHEIAAWIKKLFEADVKPNTIEVRAGRMEKALLTNVSMESTPQLSDQLPPPEEKEPSLEESLGEEVDDGRPIKHDSENLWRLKDTWKRSTKTDRKAFLRWIKKEGSEL